MITLSRRVGRFLLSSLVAAAGCLAGQASAAAVPGSQQATREIKINPSGWTTENEFLAQLKQRGLEVKGYANYYIGRFTSIAFIGGQCSGSRSEDLEFFYEKPFRFYNQTADWALEDGGDVFGMRATLRLYKDTGKGTPNRSFLLTLRCDNILEQYHPSYILVNGRRVWDAKLHPMQKGKILVPFSVKEQGYPVIDMVVDKRYTPEVRGLGFRMFFVQYLGDPGTFADLEGAASVRETSPADRLERFTFGLFPSTFDFWANTGPTFAEIKKQWKPNFKPDYPTDDLWLSPFMGQWPAGGQYHDFMLSYGGCNIIGTKPDLSLRERSGPIRGALSAENPSEDKTLLDAGLEPHWFRGEHGVIPAADKATHRRNMETERKKLEAAKQATGHPDRVVAIYEPFPPSLPSAHEYERGYDVLVLKNEEDPQYNMIMSMSRGAGRNFGKPYGFYWEQTHYPYPSLDFKLQACLLYYFSGGTWIGAECDNLPAFTSEVVAEPTLPFVKAQRFAMVHPARGKSVVPIGVIWDQGDRFTAPYNSLAHLDTFMRHLDYDHATRTITSEPNFTKILPWVPADRSKWNFSTAAMLPHYYDHVPEMRGYDLLDVFFPHYGDAFTARITRLLTGTPYGPVDFVYADRASNQHLQSFGLLVAFGHLPLDQDLQAKLTQAAESGTSVVVGAQHFKSSGGQASAFGLVLGNEEPAAGSVGGVEFKGNLFRHSGEGWETVADVDGKPLIVSRQFGKGRVYVYLGRWISEGGAALRPLLARLGQEAAPLHIAPADDQIEYVAYRKGAGAWVALFNHGNIAIGCDRLKELRATPPEPLVSQPKGPYQGEIQFRLDKLGLDGSKPLSLYEVRGIDGEDFEKVISGYSTFTFAKVPSEQRDGVVTAKLRIDKRAQYVLAPDGQGDAVFFGKP